MFLFFFLYYIEYRHSHLVDWSALDLGMKLVAGLVRSELSLVILSYLTIVATSVSDISDQPRWALRGSFHHVRDHHHPGSTAI